MAVGVYQVLLGIYGPLKYSFLLFRGNHAF